MQRQPLRIALLALAILLTATPAHAQNAPPGPALNDYRAKLAQYPSGTIFRLSISGPLDLVTPALDTIDDIATEHGLLVERQAPPN